MNFWIWVKLNSEEVSWTCVIKEWFSSFCAHHHYVTNVLPQHLFSQQSNLISSSSSTLSKFKYLWSFLIQHNNASYTWRWHKHNFVSKIFCYFIQRSGLIHILPPLIQIEAMQLCSLNSILWQLNHFLERCNSYILIWQFPLLGLRQPLHF